jgi:hypothetical protein
MTRPVVDGEQELVTVAAEAPIQILVATLGHLAVADADTLDALASSILRA